MTVHKPLTLLKSRKFGPLFVTQFLGAANDNLFKNALVILVVYRLGEAAGIAPAVVGTLAAAAFILPFFLFSATAGQLADRFEKSRLIRWTKLFEVALMSLAAFGFFLGDPWFLMGVLFLMGAQSTLFGPLKYAILPDHLGEHDLVGGNALIEAGTFLAILLGTIAGGLLILTDQGVPLVSLSLVAVAVLGYVASRGIPMAPAAAPGLRVSWNILAETAAIVRTARERRDVFLSVLGISWFWLVGATYLTQFPAFAKDSLGADNQVVTLFLTVFSVGVGAGSMLCSKLLKGDISARYVPWAALAITIVSIDMALAAGAWARAPHLLGIGEFLRHPGAVHILADLLLVSVFGGIFAVPLYAILQARSEASHRARVIAANNVLNAAFMTAGTLITALLLAAGVSIPGVFIILGLANGVVALVICGLLPEMVLKSMLRRILGLLYRVEVRGLENWDKVGERVLIVANHVSLIDAVLLAVFLPGRPTFAINTYVAQWWWVAPFLKIIDAFPLDPMNPMSIKSLTRAVEQGRRVVMFPEGRITVTGALMKVYDGSGMIADRTHADILAVRIDGAQFTPFSYLKGKLRRRLFPKIRLTMLPPRRIVVDEALRGRVRRRAAGERMFDILSEMTFATTDTGRTIPEAVMDARAIHGGGKVIEDIDRKPIGYGKVLLGSLVLGRKLARLGKPGDAIGVLLPNAVGSAVTVLALQTYGRVPAMLNFTAGPTNLLSACVAARVNHVLTSRRFIEMARLGETVAKLAEQVKVIYLDDVRASIGATDKLRGLVSLPFIRRVHRRHSAGPDAPAVVLFTSGSEGMPKGVVLSHRNVVANCAQIAARIDFSTADTVLNALPMFHAFGLTAGTLLPLLGGMKVFLYPSPLHYRIVPEMAYDTGATVMFGTDTFLNGYARVAHPYDFHSVRFMVAGAEKVKDATRALWMEKFGLRILEGYGATETAPVLAVNTPMQFRSGTVGRLLPGIEVRVEPVPGIESGGRLSVKGPNVMLGYYMADRPGDLQPPPGGWYDTGDIVTIDRDGFVGIQGRAKRFAKVAGEMVSLGAVEDLVEQLWPGHAHAVVTIPDERKGEQLVLVTTFAEAERAPLAQWMKGHGASELGVPRTIQLRDKLPVLGTGKTDYVTLEREVREAAVPAQGPVILARFSDTDEHR